MEFELICKNCGKKYTRPYKITFCSLKCSGSYNGRHGKVGGNTSSLKKFIELYGEVEGTQRYKEKGKKLSKAHKGRTGGMKGKKHTEETKRKLSCSVKNSQYHTEIRGKSFEEIRGKGAARKLSHKMKGIFSKEWFIEKYGEKDGSRLYKERGEHISKVSHFRKYNKTNKSNYSRMSQELFWKIYNKLTIQENDKIYFAELNHEYSCNLSHSCFDFVHLPKKKVIEFNGDLFHANPMIFDKDDTPNPFDEKLTSKQIWAADKIKLGKARGNGFEILIIWELDYKNDEEKEISRCIEFLSGDNDE